ncbi:4'-phosphopantetheinyl transferase family protein [Psychroflexus salis]|uniref:4'-phosphopantetheinyl transferase n=1 Tax=Psychroflexus salis TaxID=1526574 RepID=A0A917EBU0_9FLAO|nr:4'-phosphopantetheinyl transferase superfamily protein [Psychroflexus salis]GGE22182.1 4'-phosphopantetheinyl transferase [Psychroflexus salis]
MPVYKTITVNEHTKVLIWKVEESFDELAKGIRLSANSQNRINNMKSDLHRRGFMSIRHLLKKFGYKDEDVVYDQNGKPHLNDGKHISISHSFEFTCVIVSDVVVGIDVEKQRNKIKKIAAKFTPIKEYRALGNGEDLVRKLTIVWGAKESLYKLYGKQGLLFLHDIFVKDFNFEAGETTAEVTYNSLKKEYVLHFLEFEGFTCVYAYKDE